ncbi:DUF1533 domain-containing protein [Paraglaciecola mesophila]|nr:DUF1533 domain-containing protein [Paraglaciecola mesophila]
MEKITRLLLVMWVSVLLILGGSLHAAPDGGFALDTNIKDGMNVPAYTLIDIKGVGDKGAKIDVKLLKDGATVTMARATINDAGSWQVSLREQPPSGPYQLIISDGKHSQFVNDLYVGKRDLQARNPMGRIILSTRLKDNMHLQPYEAIQVSGLAEPGRKIDIKLKREDETLTMARVQVDGAGRWQVTMAGQKAGGPFSLTVTDSTHYQTVNGIIIGHADVKAAPEVKQVLASNTIKEQTADKVEPELQGIQEEKKPNQTKPNQTKPTIPEPPPVKKPVSEPEEAKAVAAIDNKVVPIKREFFEPKFDDLAWPLVNLNALESVPNNTPLVARKHVHFAIEPEEVSLSVGQANQIEQIYINGQALDSDEWQSNPLKIKVPSDWFRSGDNVIALVSLQEWDNTRFIGKSGRFNLSIDQFNLELSNNWSVFHSGLESL